MKAPPVLARGKGLRGLAPLAGRRAAQLLPRARLGGPMPWVIAIMVALTVIAAGGGLALDNLAGKARGDLGGLATVQIVEADRAARQRQAAAAAAALRVDPAVVRVAPVPEDRVAALVEPWLGAQAAAGGAVPLPALIDVELAADAPSGTLERLGARLAGLAPGARIDAQSEWLAPVLGALSALRWMAIGLIALLAFTSAAAVWLAARNALGSNRATIEIVHHLGGTDAQIAGIFQRSILLDSLAGGALGLVLGGLAVAMLGARFAALDSGLMAGGALTRGDWLLLVVIPLFAVAIAVYTARMTVLASLRKML